MTTASSTGMPGIRIQCPDCGRTLRAAMGELTKCPCGREHRAGESRSPEQGTLRALAAAERAVFFRLARHLGVGDEQAREIAERARAQVGPEEKLDPARVCYRLHCVCGNQMELPLAKRPKRDFRCGKCGVTYGPEQLFEVIRPSAEHQLRMQLLERASKKKPKRRVGAIARRRLIVPPAGDESTWVFGFVVGVLVPVGAALLFWQIASA